jgi:hypothetical protein
VPIRPPSVRELSTAGLPVQPTTVEHTEWHSN